MMTHRELFFAVAHGKRPRIIPFVPDITDWYGGQHRVPGTPLKYGPGVFVPGDDPIKLERGHRHPRGIPGPEPDGHPRKV